MSIVPFAAGAVNPAASLFTALSQAQPFINRVRRAFDQRDNWNAAAHEHERLAFAHSSTSSGSTGRRARNMAKKRKGSRAGPRSSGGRGMAPSNRADLSVRPPTYRIPTSVPKQVSNQVVWDVVKINTTITTSTSSINETNFYWSLNSHPQASSWAALYDQWCIPQFSATFQCAYPEGASTSPGLLYTALDFDSANNLGSIQTLEDYSTCEAAMLVAGQSTTRSVRPCVKGTLQTTASSSLNRQWIDCATPAISWFAIRSIYGICGASYPVSVVTTIWYAFRNQI